jgi:hypothetical protein
MEQNVKGNNCDDSNLMLTWVTSLDKTKILYWLLQIVFKYVVAWL